MVFGNGKRADWDIGIVPGLCVRDKGVRAVPEKKVVDELCKETSVCCSLPFPTFHIYLYMFLWCVWGC